MRASRTNVEMRSVRLQSLRRLFAWRTRFVEGTMQGNSFNMFVHSVLALAFLLVSQSWGRTNTFVSSFRVMTLFLYAPRQRRLPEHPFVPLVGKLPTSFSSSVPHQATQIGTSTVHHTQGGRVLLDSPAKHDWHVIKQLIENNRLLQSTTSGAICVGGSFAHKCKKCNKFDNNATFLPLIRHEEAHRCTFDVYTSSLLLPGSSIACPELFPRVGRDGCFLAPLAGGLP